MGGKERRGGLGGGRPRGDSLKIFETATPAMGERGGPFLLNFGRARKGTGEKGLGRRRAGGGLEGGRPRGDPPKIPETATPAKF